MRFVNRVRLTAAFGACVCLASGMAAAAPGAASRVYGPTVEKGEVELEFRGARLVGGAEGGEGAYVYEGAYGLTDWWRAGVVLETENEPGASLEVEAVEFENVFELPSFPGAPINFGVYAEYELKTDGTNDALELRWLAEYDGGPFNTKFNFNVERAFGGGERFEFGYGWIGSYEVFHDISLGVEAFGELGDTQDFGGLSAREHYAGPVVLFEIEPAGMPGEIEVETGYLFGLGGAEAEGQIRLLVEWEFKF